MTIKQQFGKVVLPLLPFNARFIRAIRFEFNAFITRMLVKIGPRTRKKIRSINTSEGVLLNLGSGGRGHNDWINIDIYRTHLDQSLALDIRHRLPFRANLAECIFAEHVLEHIEFREEVPVVLSNCLRILKPRGIIRIVVPDGRRWVEAYYTNEPDKWQALGMEQLPDDMPTPMTMLNHVFHQGGEHFFAYDFETLKWVLSEAGFVDIQQKSFGESSNPSFALDRAEHAPYSLYVEAKKPD